MHQLHSGHLASKECRWMDGWMDVTLSLWMCVYVCLFFVCVLLRHNSSVVCMVGITYVYIDTVFGFYGYILLFFLSFLNTHLYSLVGCLSMIGHMLLGVLYACVLYFSICTCSAQLSMFHMERRSRNTLIIIIIIIKSGREWTSSSWLIGLIRCIF